MRPSPSLQSICLEDLDAPVPRFVRCVALPAGRLGLGLAADGSPAWRDEAAATCPIAVAGDGGLALTRTAAAPEVRVERAGRAVDVPVLRPALLLDGDVLVVNGHRVRLYRHGPIARAHRPRPLRGKLAALTAAAAVTLAAGVPATVGATPPIEVRDRPPAPPPLPRAKGTVTAKVGAIRGPGKVTRAKVESAVAATVPTVSACYNRSLARGAPVAGAVDLEFTLGKSGKPEAVTVVKDATRDKSLAECAVGAIKARAFEAPTGGSVTVPVTYTFSRTDLGLGTLVARP